ncbi:hypothetical protein ACIBCN_15420 [Nocardia sp. NPDC051052]|uniref:hypothetical protein n=1 Tax=Nocardia sp. NPDC051052 TaxID=3364322 RepID=UPI00378A674D
MSAVTVALLVGFVCCTLLIRALRSRGDELDTSRVVVEDDRVRGLRGTEPGVLDA